MDSLEGSLNRGVLRRTSSLLWYNHSLGIATCCFSRFRFVLCERSRVSSRTFWLCEGECARLSHFPFAILLNKDSRVLNIDFEIVAQLIIPHMRAATFGPLGR